MASVRSRPADNWARSSWTWTASSRVGQRTSACSVSLLGSRRSTMGIPKAAVLPLPVWAWPITSLPSSAGGMAPVWIGVV